MNKHGQSRVIIIGAAGRDFHNFNVVFRDDPLTRVVAFTTAEIPDIAGRTYTPSLSGPLYLKGIPIVDESELTQLIRRERVDWVYFSYSDISHQDVMHKASQVLAAGANFGLLGPESTTIKSRRPVVSVGAVRTGGGAKARLPAAWPGSSWSRAGAPPLSSTPCPTATWRHRPSNASATWKTWTNSRRRWRSARNTSR